MCACSVSPVVEFLAGLGGGAGRGGRGWARACWSESVSLLSVHVCSDDLRLAGQTAHGQALGGYRLCIPLLSLLSKAVHSPRRVVYFARISFEKLTTPRLKWLAALVKFQDGKEFEPKGKAFKVKGELTDAATLASLNRWPQCVSVFMSGSPHLGDVRSMTLRKSCAQKRVAFALLLDCTWYLSSLLAASGNKEQGGALHCFVQNRHLQPDGGELFRSNSPTWSSLCRVSA